MRSRQLRILIIKYLGSVDCKESQRLGLWFYTSPTRLYFFSLACNVGRHGIFVHLSLACNVGRHGIFVHLSESY